MRWKVIINCSNEAPSLSHTRAAQKGEKGGPRDIYRKNQRRKKGPHICLCYIWSQLVVNEYNFSLGPTDIITFELTSLQ